MKKNKVIEIICVFLLYLIFISKISFSFLGILPFQFSFFIYQYGMHPYLNFFLHALLSLFIFWFAIKHPYMSSLKIEYKVFLLILSFILIIQTFFQILFVNHDQSIFFQLSGLIMALGLIGIYGIFIPLYLDLKKFIVIIRKITLFLTLSSLFFLVVSHHAFRGGRFVGIFKHIPHMVSVSVIAFIFYLPALFQFSGKRILLLLCVLFLSLAIFLTATKTSLFAMFLSAPLGLLLFSKKDQLRLKFKFTFFLSLISIIFFLADPIYSQIYNISTGKSDLGLRKAQNGVNSRMEEVQRGYELFQRSPLFGSGLLYKFFKNGREDVEVDQYNSFKDPHNIFASSAVIGGVPLLFLSIVAVIMMLVSSIRGIFSDCVHIKIISLYLLCHIPILIIYHAHFSLGGIADRFYWLIFGYMGIYKES